MALGVYQRRNVDAGAAVTSSMESRWLLLGFGLLSGALLLANVLRGDAVLALVAAVWTVFGVGGFWWNTTRDDPVETRFSRSR